MIRNLVLALMLMLPPLHLVYCQQGIYFDTFRIESPEQGEGFGYALTSPGDLNQDGVPDLVVASYSATRTQLQILYLSPGGLPMATQTLPLPEGLTPGGQFGTRISYLPAEDKGAGGWLAVGEPYAKSGPQAYGAVWLAPVKANGEAGPWSSISARHPALSGIVSRDEGFGASLTWLGDLNGDGAPDLAVGAPGDLQRHTGSVYILFGDGAGGLHAAARLNPGPEMALKTGDLFGAALAFTKKFPKPGNQTLIVGAPGDNAGAYRAGAVWQIQIDASGAILAAKKWEQGAADLRTGPAAEDRFGASLAWIPDLDGDSLPELAAGAPFRDDGGRDKGGFYLLAPAAAGGIRQWARVAEGAPSFDASLTNGERWARDLVCIGDLDQDGLPDLAVAGPAGDGGRGAVWLLFPRVVSQPWLQARKTRFFRPGAVPGGYPPADSLDRIRRVQAGNTLPDLDSLALDSLPIVHMVLLLDVSGSMQRPDRLPVLQEAFIDLLAYMRPSDKVSLIVYSKSPTIVLSGEPAANREMIAEKIQGLKAQGETLPAKALKAAYETAALHLIPEGNNRILFATDGAFASEDLNPVLEKYARKEVPLTLIYFGKQAPHLIGGLQGVARKGKGEAIPFSTQSARDLLWREFSGGITP